MEGKLTAVEFLQQTLWEQAEIDKFDWDEALQMEKEQIAEAFNNSYWFIDGQEYYEKTYGK